MGTTSMTFERTIKAAPKDVYLHFTNSTGLREFLSDFGISRPREGGYVILTWNDGYTSRGEFKKLEPHSRVEFTWQGSQEPAASLVTVELQEKGDSTLVRLTHSGLDEAWGSVVNEFRKGWEFSLENLQSVIETGIDQRIARRPMLGVMPNNFVDETNYEEFKVPKGTKGNILGGVVPGMGAEAAGLRGGDVVVSLNDIVMDEFAAYARALDGKNAGDVVQVVYLRDGQQHTVPMKLSARPMPDVSADPKQLAAQVRELFDQDEKARDEILAGVTEQAASFHPAEGEWSVKDVLCHLIISERGNQSHLATLITGDEQTDFPGNIQAHNAMIQAVYPTLDDLRAALSRTEAETVALIAAIPPEFTTSRRGAYVRWGQAILQNGFHTQAHADQIKAALEAARQPA